MEDFEIVELGPIDLLNTWRAVIGVRYSVDVAGIEMANGVKITVRFEYNEAGSAEGLVEAAYEEAKRCLGVAAEKLASHSLGELLAVEQARREELRKPLEFNWPEDGGAPAS